MRLNSRQGGSALPAYSRRIPKNLKLIMKEYVTIAISKEEPLPWPEYIPKKAGKLILGTFPTKEKLRAFEFFYPNLNNPFWEILSSIADHTIKHWDKTDETVEERKKILRKLKLGITDMGARVLRLKESSADSALFPIEFTDIFGLLTAHENIDTLIVTSSSTGHSVFNWLKDYCALNKIKIKKPKDTLPWKLEIPWKNRTIKVIAVCSPSRQAARDINELKEMYGDAILHNLP